ncbi:hypothetical protein D3C78_1581520 [compost metagenome]
MALGLQLLVDLGAKTVDQHDAHAHGLDHRQILGNARELARGNGFARDTDDEGLVAEFVDIRRNRTEPGNEGEVEDGGHGRRGRGGA